MTVQNGESGRPLIVCAGVGLTVVLVIIVLLNRSQGWLAYWVGVAVALIGMPFGYYICLRRMLSQHVLLICVGVTSLLVAMGVFTNVVPPRSFISVEEWIVIGGGFGVVAVAIFVLGAKRSMLRDRNFAASLAILWWSSWGIALSLAAPFASPDSIEMQCAANLKSVGLGFTGYREHRGYRAKDVNELVKEGAVRDWQLRCPLGTRYIELHLKGYQESPEMMYVLTCPNHKPDMLMLRQDGMVHVLRPVTYRMWKLGPRPWWLHSSGKGDGAY